jgi:hypothetical protein
MFVTSMAHFPSWLRRLIAKELPQVVNVTGCTE